MEGQGVTGWFNELFSVALYKRNQGRVARQATFAALALIIALGCWRLSVTYNEYNNTMRFYVPLALLVAGVWASFRLVNMPAFADFLIAVEGEMNKVSWPSRGELFRASLVVILVIFFLAALLYAYDFILSQLLLFVDRLFT
jgi:preprotein translocase subunit SecE